MRISDWSSDVCSSDLPHCCFVGLVPVFVRRDLSERRFLGGQHHFVDRLLFGRKPAADRPGTGDITGVAVDFTTGVDQPQVAILRSEEHTSELQSLLRLSYAVFSLQKKKKQNTTQIH